MIIGDIETTEKVEYEDLLKNYYEKMEIIEEQDKEIERLYNIINDFEKYLIEEIKDYDKALNNKVFVLTEKGKESYEAEKMCFLDMLDKIQELKGSGSNE